MRNKALSVLVLLLCAALILSGCGGSGTKAPSPQNPVRITMWHTYVEQMKTSIDALVAEFNATVGAEEGIVVNITAVSNASVLNEKLLMSVNEDPGAPELPDMAVVYPSVAVSLAEKGILLDYSTQFTKDELSVYVPQFLEEGKLGGDVLYVMPIAKSTEMLYVNTTIFDRFAAETGAALSDLSTFEGIARAAEAYYEWTDAKTPDIHGDGKTFYYPDIPFNFAMTGFEQLGDHFVKGKNLDLSSTTFQRIWNCYYPGAVKGSIAIFDDYGNYLAMTGDIVCTTSTSAGVLFYPIVVTYADNTKEEAVFAILPYPVFEGGRKIAPQRGGGMCVMKSTPEKEHAASVFLKWLTEPEQNLRFTASTGYLPVTREAFSELMAKGSGAAENENVRKMLAAAVEMQKNYDFYVPQVFDGFDGIQKTYVKNLLQFAERDRQHYLDLLKTQDSQAAYEAVSQDAFARFLEEQ